MRRYLDFDQGDSNNQATDLATSDHGSGTDTTHDHGSGSGEQGSGSGGAAPCCSCHHASLPQGYIDRFGEGYIFSQPFDFTPQAGCYEVGSAGPVRFSDCTDPAGCMDGQCQAIAQAAGKPTGDGTEASPSILYPYFPDFTFKQGECYTWHLGLDSSLGVTAQGIQPCPRISCSRISCSRPAK